MTKRIVTHHCRSFAPCFFGAWRRLGNTDPLPRASAAVGDPGTPWEPGFFLFQRTAASGRSLYAVRRRSALTTSATPTTTIAPPIMILAVIGSLRISQPSSTATAGFTYA
jgi:hypothetical protein